MLASSLNQVHVCLRYISHTKLARAIGVGYAMPLNCQNFKVNFQLETHQNGKELQHFNMTLINAHVGLINSLPMKCLSVFECFTVYSAPCVLSTASSTGFFETFGILKTEDFINGVVGKSPSIRSCGIIRS